MPHVNREDHNTYMRVYRQKNRDRINQQAAERKLWKQMTEDDVVRARASDALDVLLSNGDRVVIAGVYSFLRRCTPKMVEELVGRASKLT